MSIVFSEKTRRTRLALRWPFSRQITLSVGTLLVLLAVWWAVAALQWVSPLFLPPPGQVLAKLITIAGPQGFMDATLWQHLGASLARILVALLAAVMIGIPVGIANFKIAAIALWPVGRRVVSVETARAAREANARRRFQ